MRSDIPKLLGLLELRMEGEITQDGLIEKHVVREYTAEIDQLYGLLEKVDDVMESVEDILVESEEKPFHLGLELHIS